jgi:hypothetical protein
VNNATEKLHPDSHVSMLINGAADMTSSYHTLAVLRLSKKPDRVYIVWKVSSGATSGGFDRIWFFGQSQNAANKLW